MWRENFFCCRLHHGVIAAVKIAKADSAEAHVLQHEASMYDHCKRLQYKSLSGVLAAGPAIDGTAYMLATCLLPVVPVANCLLAKGQALRAVKALHSLHVLHGDIRSGNLLSVSDAEGSSDVIIIDLGQSTYCKQASEFQQELQQTRDLFC